LGCRLTIAVRREIRKREPSHPSGDAPKELPGRFGDARRAEAELDALPNPDRRFRQRPNGLLHERDVPPAIGFNGSKAHVLEQLRRRALEIVLQPVLARRQSVGYETNEVAELIGEDGRLARLPAEFFDAVGR
jgi:hypothetical protein